MANKNEKNNRDANASFAEKVTFPPIETIIETCLPPVAVYSYFLDVICKREKIDRDTARKKYGLYTYKQWRELLTPQENNI